MITRRHIVLGGAGLLALGAGLVAGDALAVEPLLALRVTRYRLSPPGWPAGLPLAIALLADIHAVEPWMTLARIRAIVAATNALRPDLVLLAGDYETGLNLRRRLLGPLRGLSRAVPMDAVGEALSGLEAPLGTYGVLGNHDMAVRDGDGVREGFAAHGIPLLENRAVRIGTGEGAFWLLGLADQWGALDDLAGAEDGTLGLADLPGTLAGVTDDRPALLLAHEPDIFPLVPPRVALTLCGHTHGGQVRLPGLGAIVVPSRYGTRYAYGHIVEGGRHLVVSGGLGVSGLPVRFLMPPEIVLVHLGGAGGAGANGMAPGEPNLGEPDPGGLGLRGSQGVAPAPQV